MKSHYSSPEMSVGDTATFSACRHASSSSTALVHNTLQSEALELVRELFWVNRPHYLVGYELNTAVSDPS
jgi:hypothetical protein